MITEYTDFSIFIFTTDSTQLACEGKLGFANPKADLRYIFEVGFAAYIGVLY